MNAFQVLSLSSLSLLLASVSLAQPLQNPPPDDPSIFESSELISVLLSTATLPVSVDQSHAMQFDLQDGTRLGGLLFVDASKGHRPLVIADFGLMSSRNSGLAGDFIEKIVNTGKLDANFLVLNDLTGPLFYTDNGSVGLGGYDAGRILNELADALPKAGVDFSELKLLGESLGGLAVLQALIEDKRLGTHHFASAITFSGVVDEASSTASVMENFGDPFSLLVGPALPTLGKLFLDYSLENFEETVEDQASWITRPDLSDAGAFFTAETAKRLSWTAPADWNPHVKRDTVQNYVLTSSALISQAGSLTVPVILVHAANDPVVDYAQFSTFAAQNKGNQNLKTFGTTKGSHCGFIATYGADWVASLMGRI